MPIISKAQIDKEVDKLRLHLIAIYGLQKAKKIALELGRVLRAEHKRRKELGNKTLKS